MTDDTTEYMVTTIDNPYNPFTQFDEWYAWDVRNGYNTSALLARIATISNSLSNPDLSQAIQNAVDEIVQENVSGMFIKVTKEHNTSMSADPTNTQ